VSAGRSGRRSDATTTSALEVVVALTSFELTESPAELQATT
jgi:hypothetical protein